MPTEAIPVFLFFVVAILFIRWMCKRPREVEDVPTQRHIIAYPMNSKQKALCGVKKVEIVEMDEPENYEWIELLNVRCSEN